MTDFQWTPRLQANVYRSTQSRTGFGKKKAKRLVCPMIRKIGLHIGLLTARSQSHDGFCCKFWIFQTRLVYSDIITRHSLFTHVISRHSNDPKVYGQLLEGCPVPDGQYLAVNLFKPKIKGCVDQQPNVCCRSANHCSDDLPVIESCRCGHESRVCRWNLRCFWAIAINSFRLPFWWRVDYKNRNYFWSVCCRTCLK